MAVKFISCKEVNDPRDAWELAASKIFDSYSSRCKGCPKSAFLGLCEEGIIKGISGGSYTTSMKNKSYAMKAAQLLKKDPSLASNENALWNKVTPNETKAYNQQMDVVITLWKNNLIQI